MGYRDCPSGHQRLALQHRLQRHHHPLHWLQRIAHFLKWKCLSGMAAGLAVEWWILGHGEHLKWRTAVERNGHLPDADPVAGTEPWPAEHFRLAQYDRVQHRQRRANRHWHGNPSL